MRYLITILALTLMFTSHASAEPKKLKKQSAPLTSAKSYIIADAAGNILRSKKVSSILPIASISKLMVAFVAVEQPLDEMLRVPTKRMVSTSIPGRVKHLSRRDLMTLSLVKSDNLAAQVLCDNIDNCVEKMNHAAVELGMVDTSFTEPTGLSSKNISTATDLLRLLIVTVNNPLLAELSSMPTAEIHTSNKPIRVRNTNPLVNKFDVVLSKTGYTRMAGGCLVMVMNSDAGQRIVILLGSRNTKTRIPETISLLKEHGS